MNASDFRAQLEEELAWRMEEIRFFQNAGSSMSGDEGEKYRRALVLVTYANFEGFCKFALTAYINAINSENLTCADVTPAIVASCLDDVFNSLRNSSKKSEFFKNSLPEDSGLHKYARDREFIENIENIMKRKVFLPDNIVDTESNLWPFVLRKNLFRLGLQHEQFSAVEPKINHLVNVRNKVAHGESKAGIPEAKYLELRDAAQNIMMTIVVSLTKAVDEKHFLYQAKAKTA